LQGDSLIDELAQLIRLQEIETRAADARKRIADAPARTAALDAKLDAARDEVARARQAHTDNQTQRRSIEKDLIAAQQQLSKSKDTLMAVKTNQEYHAMQSQIAAGTAEVGRVEERMLINMVEADDVAARLKKAEAALKAEEGAVAKERKAIETEAAEMAKVAADSVQERAALVAKLPRATLEMFERVAKARNGLAVVEAADGHCTVCHVRLRPQVYNTIRRNDSVYQCDSCQRILYFTGVHERSAEGHAAANAPGQQHADPNVS
jgi:predicted  nucleic acid-binding Zn-ribbon protein